MTFDTILFLGFPLSDAYQKRLLELSSIERELFIQKSSSPYLQEIENEGVLYLGKYLGPFIEMAALETLSFHVYSLLKKLIPQFPYEQYPLLLFALPAHV